MSIRKKTVIIIAILLATGLILTPSKLHHVEAIGGIPDTSDTKEIMYVMNKAYEILGSASQTFDISEFSSVFVDTKDYELTFQQRADIVETLGLMSTEQEKVGYLTAMQAKYIAMAQGASYLQEAVDKAKLENRGLTADEFQEIVIANHNQFPSLGSPITNKTILNFITIEIKDTRAIVTYDDGAALQEAILIKLENWLIASIVPIRIHF